MAEFEAGRHSWPLMNLAAIGKADAGRRDRHKAPMREIGFGGEAANRKYAIATAITSRPGAQNDIFQSHI